MLENFNKTETKLTNLSLSNVLFFSWYNLCYGFWGFLQVALEVKKLPADAEDVRDTQGVWSWDREDTLEEGMATHSRILAWRIPRTEEPGGPQPTGSQRVGHDWVTSTHQMREQHTKGRSCPLQLPTQIPSQSLESGARLIDRCLRKESGGQKSATSLPLPVSNSQSVE